MAERRRIRVHRLGQVEYEDGRALQLRFREARAAGLAGDTLFLLEHPPVVTLGRAGRREHLVWDAARFERAGITVVETERGGEATYHGPGQVVGYPILDLNPDRRDVRRYVRDLEEVILRALQSLGVEAHREPRWPGVWVGDAAQGDLRKVAALGVHLSRWITLHGFALNVAPDLDGFASIVPCGIQEAGVTSLHVLLGRAPARGKVDAALVQAFGEVFDADIEQAAPPAQTVSVFATRTGKEAREVLLLKRVPERGGFWQPVTGKVEPGETPAMAAVRELHEETGAHRAVESLNYQHAFGWGDAAPPVVVEETAFRAEWSGEGPRLSAEHEAMEWVGLTAALERLPFAGLREGARRALAAGTP